MPVDDADVLYVSVYSTHLNLLRYLDKGKPQSLEAWMLHLIFPQVSKETPCHGGAAVRSSKRLRATSTGDNVREVS